MMHQRNFIHRDIKPENFLIGVGKKQNLVHIIDFGLSKRYKCPKSGQHLEQKPNNNVIGTMRYCSLNAHQGHTQSRRDDLEAIGNIIVYFMKGGNLPWMEAEVRIPENMTKCRSFYEDKEREQLNIKQETTVESLCEGLPECCRKYMTYVRNLRFEEKPNYKMLRGLFDESCLELNNGKPIDADQKFDWYYQRQKILEEKAR